MLRLVCILTIILIGHCHRTWYFPSSPPIPPPLPHCSRFHRPFNLTDYCKIYTTLSIYTQYRWHKARNQSVLNKSVLVCIPVQTNTRCPLQAITTSIMETGHLEISCPLSKECLSQKRTLQCDKDAPDR